MLQLAPITQTLRTLNLIGMGRTEFDALLLTFHVLKQRALGYDGASEPRAGGFKGVLNTVGLL